MPRPSFDGQTVMRRVDRLVDVQIREQLADSLEPLTAKGLAGHAAYLDTMSEFVLD